MLQPEGGTPHDALMVRVPLAECRFLDPRLAANAERRPIEDAVNIPLAELPQRTYELPPRDVVIPVVGLSPWAERAVAWLTSNGRRAAVQGGFRYADPPRRMAVVQVGRLWRPSPFLAEVLPQLTPGRALDLGCGTGRDAIFAASWGWQVTAVDVLPDALERARKLAGRCARAIEPIEWRQVDLELAPPTFESGFDLVFAFRYLHRPLLGRLAEWLKPGGSLIYETFTTVHRARHGKPARDEHVLQAGELPELLAGFEIRHSSEGWRGTAHTARVWAVGK